MYPHTLDLPDGRGQRADLGLEHDLAVLEAGVGTAGGDQLRDACPVAGPAVTGAGVDADLLDKHGDRGGQVAVQLARSHWPDQRVRCGGRGLAERHQRLVGPHLAGRTPVQLQLRPQAEYLLGGTDDRGAHASPP
jgi:hypothetical protein